MTSWFGVYGWRHAGDIKAMRPFLVMSLSVLTLSVCGDFRSSVDGDPFDPIGQIDVVLSAVGRREDWRPSIIVIRYGFAASFWGVSTMVFVSMIAINSFASGHDDKKVWF